MGQTIERMKQGYSKIRNEALASTFEYMGYIEHWGSGILRVMQQVRDAGLREPEFLGGDTDLRINIYRESMIPPVDDGIATGLRRDSSSGEVRDGARFNIGECAMVRDGARFNAGECAIVRDNTVDLSPQAKQIMGILSSGEALSREQIEKVLGVRKRRAQILLNELVKKDLVVRVGAARQTRYKAMGNRENT